MFSGNPRKFDRQLKQRIRKLVENHTQIDFNKTLYYIELQATFTYICMTKTKQPHAKNISFLKY